MQMLSVTLTNVDSELLDNREKIKILTKNNNALSLKVESLTKKVDKKNDEIKDLKEENRHLKQMVDYFQNLFRRLVNFIKKRMLSKDEQREKYIDVSSELYEHGIFSDDTIKEIHEKYIYGKTHNSKSKDDDFEL